MSRWLRVFACVTAHALLVAAALAALHPAPLPLAVAMVAAGALVSWLGVRAFVPEVRE